MIAKLCMYRNAYAEKVVMTADEQDDSPSPSKSARKRVATELQELGQRLVEMKDAKLAALPLPEALREAIGVAKRITAREGLRRQMQFIGKLMREIDTEELRAALAVEEGQRQAANRRFHLAEQWRDRLMRSGDEGMTAFCTAFPQADGEFGRQLLGAARADAGAGGQAAKALWRFVLETVSQGRVE